MVLPIVTPAPVVASHAEAFRDLFDNQCEFRHFQNYLTGLMVLENTSMANISNCILTSASWQKYPISLCDQWPSCIGPFKGFGHGLIEVVDEIKDPLFQVFDGGETGAFE